ncbi:hypothetical protein QF000_004014 [Paraburkholderia atlantica]|uniref:Uncharacterized protein n=1 Tax=Paraburkholderia atlantica TaxID=2654982 RepID=A0A7W8VBA6_PARAM|nr:hypothetical protein [Paraburkholderia atlantica]MBB5429684.1 hypothetical protein [Paraburkholderia atlantica]
MKTYCERCMAALHFVAFEPVRGSIAGNWMMRLHSNPRLNFELPLPDTTGRGLQVEAAMVRSST